MITIVLISINGEAMPTPAEGGYSVTLSDLDSENTSRSETGVLHRERVRTGVCKISANWYVDRTELERLVISTKPDKLTVRYYFGGEYKTATMYAGDKTIALDKIYDGGSYWNFTCSFTEY